MLGGGSESEPSFIVIAWLLSRVSADGVEHALSVVTATNIIKQSTACRLVSMVDSRVLGREIPAALLRFRTPERVPYQWAWYARLTSLTNTPSFEISRIRNGRRVRVQVMVSGYSCDALRESSDLVAAAYAGACECSRIQVVKNHKTPKIKPLRR